MGVCFICDIQAPIKDLRLASTLPLYENLKRCAIDLLDEKLLAKLSAGDSVARPGFRCVGALGQSCLWGPPHSQRHYDRVHRLLSWAFSPDFLWTPNATKETSQSQVMHYFFYAPAENHDKNHKNNVSPLLNYFSMWLVGAPKMWGPWGSCPTCPLINPALSVALEYRYHPSCLTCAYNIERFWLNSTNTGDYVKQTRGVCPCFCRAWDVHTGKTAVYRWMLLLQNGGALWSIHKAT